MSKTRLLVVLLSVMVVCLGGMRAGAIVWHDSDGTSYEWQHDPVCGCLLDIQYPRHNMDLFDLGGTPPSPDDPTVRQTVTNRTSLRWTDWHIRITNGAIMQDSWQVYKVGSQGTPWVVEVYQTMWYEPWQQEVITELFCHNVIGSGTYVDPLEKLYVEFSYLVLDPNQNVNISQYPTDWYPIPEPSSILALLSGVAALGFGLRRRA